MVIARPSSGSVKGLLDLPAELCLRVFDFLPNQAPADLAALARTCKTTWWPAARVLYRNIILSPELDRDKHNCKKLLSFLRLIHTLLISDKQYLTMVEQMRIEIAEPTFLSDLINYTSTNAKYFSDLEHLSTSISMEIDQTMGRIWSNVLDWRDAVDLILQRSPKLRHIDIVGDVKQTEWELQLHLYRKLEIIYLHGTKVLTLQGLADLALIPNLKSLQLFSVRGQLHHWPVTFSAVPQAQFPSLVHLKILGFPVIATYTPDLLTMVPKLRSLELQWIYDPRDQTFDSPTPLSSILNGAHSSPTSPRPRLDKTLERLRVYPIWPCMDNRRYYVQYAKKWDKNFFGSLKFLRSLKLLEIPFIVPVHRIIHSLPESLEELHLTDENLFRLDLGEDLERISAVLSQLGPTAGLHNMKAVFLKFRRLDPSNLCQHIMDRMKGICQEADIKLNIVLNYVPETEWGLKEN